MKSYWLVKKIAEDDEELNRYYLAEDVDVEIERLRKDAERYRKWKENGLSYSNGYYHLDLYMYNPDGICEYRNADDVADAAIEEQG